MDVLALPHLLERRKRTLRILRSLCGMWGVLPTSYWIQGPVKLLDGGLPFVPASRFVEVLRGLSEGETVAVKALSVFQSEDGSRLYKVGIGSPRPVLQAAKHYLATGSGSCYLEALGPSKHTSILWCPHGLPREAAMHHISLDEKREHPRIRH